MNIKRILAGLALPLFAASLWAQADTLKMETRTFSIKGKDTLRLDAYYGVAPAATACGDTATAARRPVLIHIHGGGFVGGSRINAAQEVFCRHMAGRGWLVVNTDYRLAGLSYSGKDATVSNPYNVDGTLTAIRMACADVVDAINYAIGQPEWNADPKTVCLAGGSAGAITALQLEYDLCNGIGYTHRLDSQVCIKGLIAQAGCIASKADTLTWKSKPCPIMSFHGDKDSIIPSRRSTSWGPGSKVDCNFFGPEYYLGQCREMGVPYWKWTEWGTDHVMAMKPLTHYLEEQYRFLTDFCAGGLQTATSTEVRDREPASMRDVGAMVKYVPLYILGYGKYLKDMDSGNAVKPKSIVY